MRSLFSNRGIALLWVMGVGLLGLSNVLDGLATGIRAGGFDRQLANALNTFNNFPAEIIAAVFNAVGYSPQVKLPGVFVSLDAKLALFGAGLLFLLIGLVLQYRTIKSAAFFDDFIGLGLLYAGVQVATGIWVKAGILPSPLRIGALAFVLTGTVIISAIRAKVMIDSRIFFRSALLIFLIFLFLFPSPTLAWIADALQVIAKAGNSLNLPFFFSVLAALGFLIAAPLIYSIGQVPKKPPPSVDQIRDKINKALDDMKKN